MRTRQAARSELVTPSGKRIGSHVVETNARCLIEAVRQIPEPRHIRLEEGTLSEWLYEVLSPHARKVVVAAVSESRGPKDDRRDAFGRSETPGKRCFARHRAFFEKDVRQWLAELGIEASPPRPSAE